ncbi:MAG: Lon protease family protein [Candidatus Krumholzibacteriia bacterium]
MPENRRLKSAKPFPELPIEKLRWRCDPKRLGFRTTDDLKVKPEIIGQARALAALRLGLEIDSPGYNIFVVGLTGTGKTTTIRRLFEELNLVGDIPQDLCYVNNFKRPEAPRVILMPPGRGCALRKDMQGFVADIRRSLPEVYESDEYQTRRRRILDDFKERGRNAFKDFEAHVQAENFQIVQIQMGPLTHAELHPTVAGEPVSIDKLKDLTKEERFDPKELERLRKKYDELAQGLQNVLKEGRKIERGLRETLRKLDREFGALVVRDPIQELREKYHDIASVGEYLDDVQESILDTLGRFVRAQEDSNPHEDGMGRADSDFFEYEVNVAVDNDGAKGPPIVIEPSPTYKNLFGSIDHVPDRSGMWRSDFTKICAGSLLRANGGFLVFNLLDVASDPAVWPTLKRTLKNRKAEIRTHDLFAGLTGSSLKPEPVDLDVKVVVIGDAYSYHLLYSYDDEFRKIFKVKADFDSSMKRDRKSLRQYAGFLSHLVRNEGLLPFGASGVATVAEAGARLAGRQTKLSTRFSDIADIAREANYWARKENSRVVKEAHVDRALRRRIERVNLLEDRLQQSIENGVLLLDTRGTKPGQVNALTVYDLGDYAFGRPSRITSEVSMGRSGIINIEREANLSGSTHDKGVLILAGYLRGKYAQTRPLTLSASLAFEQSYGGVDGDSASAAELFTLLSAIGQIPLRQDLAVTGSINQKGELQPIGGVNEKIEGFFDVCTARGLTGSQGVIIPHQNVPELMLRKDVLDAVRAGRFHIYAVKNVDQGIELMTGFKAGRRTPSGGYEQNTVNGVVDDALAELAEEIKEFVEGSDSTSGRPPAQGLSEEDEDEGIELRRAGARRRRSGPTRRRTLRRRS